MSKFFSTLQQFRSFYFQNSPKNIEEAIEYFAVFGGMGWSVDTSKSLELLIEEKVLKNYRYIHGDITKVTQSNKLYHSLLSALATGDRREHAAFRKVKVSRKDGEEAIDFLMDNDLLEMDKPQLRKDKDEDISNKLHFTLPFMRFWFSSISPYYKGIKDGDYTEMKSQFENRKQEFSNYIYERLVLELIKTSFKDDKIEKIGSYWDKNVDIDIFAKTKSGKLIVGSWKFSKSKANKSELTKLKEKCSQAGLNVDKFVIFSKSGFSKEFKSEKGETLMLLTFKNFNRLIENLNPDDLIENRNKKY